MVIFQINDGTVPWDWAYEWDHSVLPAFNDKRRAIIVEVSKENGKFILVVQYADTMDKQLTASQMHQRVRNHRKCSYEDIVIF